MRRKQLRRLSEKAKELHGKRETRIPVVRFFGFKAGKVYITNQQERHVENAQSVPDCLIPPGAIHILAARDGSDDAEISIEATPGPFGHHITMRDEENGFDVQAEGLPLDEFPFWEEPVLS